MKKKTSRLRYLHTFTDRHGAVRHYFRRDGKRIALPGEVGSPKFNHAYHAALTAVTVTQKSSTKKHKTWARDRPDREPKIGVYLLMLKGKVVYVGSSMNLQQRVADHWTNGRRFDKAFFIGTAANERAGLEKTLIAAIKPPQNRVGTNQESSLANFDDRFANIAPSH